MDTKNKTLRYAEFTESRLANIYDILWPLGTDSDFFITLASKQPNSTIIDLGCGTGILTYELAKHGHTLIGVEPARAMFDVARKRPLSDKVRWINGYAKDIPEIQADAVIMTSHVAQFFLEEKEWQLTLSKLHTVIKPGGRLIFDSRNPQMKPWLSWTRESTLRTVKTPEGEITAWYQFSSVTGNHVKYSLHYYFESTKEELTSNNELIYRSREELTQSLDAAGFKIDQVYGDWNGSPANEQSEELIFECKRI